MCTTGMYTLLSSMLIGYNDILNKKGKKKKLDHYAFSVSSLLGWNDKHGLDSKTAAGAVLVLVYPEKCFKWHLCSLLCLSSSVGKKCCISSIFTVLLPTAVCLPSW